jgi:hypothetical protein
MSSTKPAYDVFVTIIFASVALMLLFPSNKYLPLDRRLSCIWGATLCGLVAYCFNNSLNPLEFVDVDVLIVLSAIMAINFLLLRHPWLSWGIERMQWYIQNDVDKAFYIVSIMSFLISQIIMNDGLCLMIVHPVLDAFIKNSRISSPRTSDNSDYHIYDPFYFMLNIACSANIGSVMTFAGNPQNLIIAQYLGNYMNCAVFWAYMLVPAVVSWILTVGLINYLRKEAIRSLRDGKQSWALISGVEMVPMSKSRKNERTRGGDDSADADDDHHLYSEERKDGDNQPLEAPTSSPPKSGKSKKMKNQSPPAPEDPSKGVNSPKKIPLTELEGKKHFFQAF